MVGYPPRYRKPDESLKCFLKHCPICVLQGHGRSEIPNNGNSRGRTFQDVLRSSQLRLEADLLPQATTLFQCTPMGRSKAVFQLRYYISGQQQKLLVCVHVCSNLHMHRHIVTGMAAVFSIRFNVERGACIIRPLFVNLYDT